MDQDVELWERELLATGWIKHSATVYLSPSGLYYRGPFKAWELMKTHPELNVKTNVLR